MNNTLRPQVHVLVLRLPLTLCLGRVTARRGHEGGVEGTAGLGVVHRMNGSLSRAGLPTPAEGVASVSVRLYAHTYHADSYIHS